MSSTQKDDSSEAPVLVEHEKSPVEGKGRSLQSHGSGPKEVGITTKAAEAARARAKISAARRSCVSSRATLAILLVISAAVLGGALLHARTHTARPNEWMLVINDGEMIRAGVGITHTARPGDQLAKFPSTLNKVSFKAQQVTKEKQGVEVSGFIVWVVNRIADGPFKAYKHLGGLTGDGLSNANSQLKLMAESVVRSQVAKISIEEAMTKREAIREAVRTAMQDVVKGWGVWIETVEVTDVRVMSKILFENLQTEFREKQSTLSEGIRIQHRQKLELARIQANLETKKAAALADGNAATHKAKELLKAKEEEAALEERHQDLALAELQRAQELERAKAKQVEESDKEKHACQLLRIEREREAGLRREAVKAELADYKVSKELARKRLELELELEATSKQLEVENQMTPRNMQKASLDSLVKIYRELPIQNVDVRHVNFGGAAFGGGEEGDTGVTTLGTLMPSLSAAVLGLREAQFGDSGAATGAK